ncbi:MAG: rod shape-determining protein MreC [Candidatus Magasanikbacteria bacterium]|nr:rod shape-determining protein MreC [Candidatus Magasanikbacteria bacterium]
MNLNRKKTLISISFFIFFIILLHYVGWLLPVENFFRRLIVPGSKAMYTWSYWINPEEIDRVEELEEMKTKYKELEDKLLSVQVDQVQLDLLKEENQKLRTQLNFYDEHNNYEYIGAEVVGENIDPVGSTVILDKGQNYNINEGDPVIVNNGIIIGRILRVEEDISVVRLINDSQSKIAATLTNEDRSIGLVEGGYGISVRMNFIPQNEKINVGDTVVTSGLEEGVPRGLLIGNVEVVEKEAYQPFQKAVLSPFVDLDKIIFVSVITNS